MSGNRFCFIVPTFNAASTLQQMLLSIVGQSYDNWKIVITDDMSDGDQRTQMSKIVNSVRCLLKREDQYKKIAFYLNDRKKWEVENVLTMIHSDCEDDDIVCRIDGDDWLTELDALAMINSVYENIADKDTAIWTAHRWGMTGRNISNSLPQDADPYGHPWVSSHLKTFRKHLINRIPYVNFTNKSGSLVRRAGDQALYLPVLHRATTRGFIPHVMYHYSIDEQGGKVYQSQDAKFQKEEADFIRQRGYVNEGPAWEDVLFRHRRLRDV